MTMDLVGYKAVCELEDATSGSHPGHRYVSLLFPMEQAESGAEVWSKGVVEFCTSWRLHC